MKLSILGVMLSVTYLVIFILCTVYALYMVVYHPAGSEFAGLPAIIVTLPWSVITTIVMGITGLAQYYDNVASRPIMNVLMPALILLPSALLNAWLLYKLGKALK